MTLTKTATLALAGLGLWTGLLFLGGCAPRYLDKSPMTVLNYGYVPVDQKVISNYKALVAINPNDPQAGKAHYWIGQDAFNRQDWKTASTQFTLTVNRFPRSEWAPAAGIMLARVYVKQERYLAALSWLAKLLGKYPAADAQQAITALAEKIINDNLSLEELARVRASYRGTEWDAQALFVSGKRQLDQGKPDVAIQLFKEFMQTFPNSRFVNMAKDLISKATRIIPINRNRIGCLVPLTGPYAPYGETIKQGMEVAIKQLNQQRRPDEQLGLIMADSRGTTAGAVAGLIYLRDVEKVMAIIGPTLSDEVKGIIPELKRQPIPVITTSAGEEGLPLLDPYMFRYMLTNETQGAAMAEYVVLRKNLHRIGIISGEAQYDQLLARAFARKATALGAEIVGQLNYPQGATDFKTQMLALGGIDPGKLKDADLRERKALDRLMGKVAVQFNNIISPASRDSAAGVTKTAKPEKKIAIIRFRETGELTTKLGLGKTMTEKFSYALAPMQGGEVMTQADTLKKLRLAGLSPFQIDTTLSEKAGAALGVDYLVLGEVVQRPQDILVNPGEDSPRATFDVKLNLISAHSGRVLTSAEKPWVKSTPPSQNLKDMDALYLPVPARDAILITSQLEFYEIKVPVFGSDAWLTSELLRQGRDVLDHAVFSVAFWPDLPDRRSQEFVSLYQTMFANRPTALAAQAYDAMWLVAAILKTMPATEMRRSAFQRQLLAMHAFNGITGRAIITPKGEIERQPIFLEINHDKLGRVR